MRANLELHIKELVLHGLSPGDKYRIGEAVERELTRLFSEQGIPASLGHGGAIERIDGVRFEMAHGSRAEKVGSQVARSVYGGLKR